MSENELELDNLAQSCNENLKTSTFPWILILYLKHQIYKILIHSCLAGLSLELEFVPYQLSHCRFKSDKPHTNQKYPTQSHSTPLKAPQCYIHLRCLFFAQKMPRLCSYIRLLDWLMRQFGCWEEATVVCMFMLRTKPGTCTPRYTFQTPTATHK